MGIAVLPPDVNESNWAFTVVGGTIRFGLGAVKGLGESAVESILEARRRVGRFRDFGHFAEEVEARTLNRKVFESLIKAGAFDELGAERWVLWASLDRVLDYAQRRREEREAGQVSLFGGGSSAQTPFERGAPAWAEGDRLRLEKEALGFFLTGNPLAEHEARLKHLATATTIDVREGVIEGQVTLGGVVSRLRKTKIKSGPNAGRLMGRFVLEDLHGSLPAALFADAMQRWGGLLEDGAVVLVKGMVRTGGAEPELTIDEVTPLEEATGRLISSLELAVVAGLPQREMLRLRELLVENPGEVPVVFKVRTPAGEVAIDVPEHYRVRFDNGLTASLEQILGPGSVRACYAA